MQVRLMTFERYPTTDRNELGRAALGFCRAARVQPKIRSTRFYWVDGNTVGIIMEGEEGCFDHNPEPDPEFLKAVYGLADIASRGMFETWADPGLGERGWERAGRPTGTR